MGRRQAAALAWAATAVAAVLAAAVLVLGFARAGSVPGLPPFRLADALVRVALVSLPLTAVVIASREPRNAVWMVLAGMPLPGMVNAFALEYAARSLVIDPGCCPGGEVAAWVGAWAYNAAAGLPALLLLLFPTGRLPSRRLRAVAWAVPVAAVTGFVSFAFAPGPVEPAWPMRNPLGLERTASVLSVLAVGSQGLAGGAILSGVAALVWRYRHAAQDERQQLKWFTLAGSLLPVGLGGYVGYFVVLGGRDPVLSTLIGLLDAAVVAALAASVGIAVLRYHLYDVDVVVNRALVYAALATLVTAIYAVVVAAATLVLGLQVSGQGFVVSVLATAAVAVTFQPVRERFQRMADRLVYGSLATPYEALASFTRRLEDAEPTGELLVRMAQVVAESTGAPRADVWLAVEGQLRRVATWPRSEIVPATVDLREPFSVPGADHAVPVRYQHELLGALALTGRRGESLRPIERKLLADLSAQAGLLLRNARLDSELGTRMAELAASRRRLVLAQDAERHRLERDLHDGVQQQLTAALAKVRLARNQMVSDPRRADDLLVELTEELRQTGKELRELAHGIRPPVLADAGLVTAVGARLDRMDLAVTLDAADAVRRARYADEVEAAGYFFVCEALANVLKYAAASHVDVRLAEEDGELCVRIADDGLGFDLSTTPTSGLRGLHDRLDAVGGHLDVRSQPAHGTVLVARLPARRAAP